MNDIPFPPTHMMFDGPQDEAIFKANGEEYLRLYQDLAGLQPNEVMLDVGCGIGRKTIPLTDYLKDDAVYYGIDCNLAGVRWCLENITPFAANFAFDHVDIYAPGYNPNGTVRPEDFYFPFADDTFDFVVMNSVFTHMLAPGIENYLRETYRVLKPGGRCFITWFIAGEATENFPHKHEHGYLANPSFPEQAIAYSWPFIVVAYYDTGFACDRVDYGTWSGQPGLTHQDIIIARKEER